MCGQRVIVKKITSSPEETVDNTNVLLPSNQTGLYYGSDTKLNKGPQSDANTIVFK